jgi:hypothetical protein
MMARVYLSWYRWFCIDYKDVLECNPHAAIQAEIVQQTVMRKLYVLQNVHVPGMKKGESLALNRYQAIEILAYVTAVIYAMELGLV